MLLVYSILLSLAFALMMPLFLLRRDKYATGFRERLGNYPAFEHDGHPVIWLHCVSVGEANAARPLVDALLAKFPRHRLIVSTTTKTGQELAAQAFAGKAAAVFYFPFDWKFSVRKALAHYRPSVILLMETEIWPRLISEAKLAGAGVVIVNGRLSDRSARRYSLIGPIIKNVLNRIDLALMQSESDAERIVSLGRDRARVVVTGNLKFDLELNDTDRAVTEALDTRFKISNLTGETSLSRPLIVAASTHEPEERWVLEAFCSVAAGVGRIKPRLLIAPRHPERFAAVEKLVSDFRRDPACEWPRYSFKRRSEPGSAEDKDADIIILDSIGELRAVYPLAEIVFVGGSLIPHGGQSILEPAAAGKAIITGYHTHNFEAVVRTFIGNNALIQLPDKTGEQIVDELFLAVSDLLENEADRHSLGVNAAAVMNANRGATAKTVELLAGILESR
ncbi:MAG: 3-deoxy-D-manno-octulosonic acid transferase [Acidobacteria bacterium]|nr:3-deoxy-D-manno-octulosonic acid transferase [Acidobacteriota bacterium]